MEQLSLDLLSLFSAVAEASSFSEAARALALPKSSVSRGVSQLEAKLGTQLLNRTTRQVALTSAGAALQARIRPLLGSLRDSVSSLPAGEKEPAGELRLTAPNDLAATFLPDVVARFTARFPAVRVDVRLTNRVVDLVSEGFDLAIRAMGSKPKDSSLVMRKIADVEMQLFASPSYVARKGAMRSAQQVASHDWVLFRGLLPVRALRLTAASARVLGDDFFFIREAIRAGTGIGLLPTFLAQADLEKGNLVRVLPQFSQSGGGFALLHPRTRHPMRKVTAFRDVVLEVVSGRPPSPG